VGTRISAQVRSHAQKVLTDYSPNSQLNDGELDTGRVSSEHINESLSMSKDHVRSELPVQQSDTGALKLDDAEYHMSTNLNQGHKRQRKTAENTIDVSKIRVTQVGCSELSQPALALKPKPPSEDCIPQDCHSNFGGEGGGRLGRSKEIFESLSNGNYRANKACDSDPLKPLEPEGPATPGFLSMAAQSERLQNTPGRD